MVRGQQKPNTPFAMADRLSPFVQPTPKTKNTKAHQDSLTPRWRHSGQPSGPLQCQPKSGVKQHLNDNDSREETMTGRVFQLAGKVGRLMAVPAAAILLIGSASDATAEKLRVGYLKFVTFGGIYAAEQNGWYEDAGLDVELVLFDSGPPLLEAMASGSVDVGALGGVPSLRTMSQDVFPLRIISAVADVSSSLKIVATDEIQSMDDLRGKDISIPWATTQHLVMGKALAQHDMTFDDVNLIQMEAIDGQAALVAGRLDATIPVPATLEQILASRDDIHVIFEPSDFDPPVAIFDVWVAPADVLEERGDEIKKVLDIWHGQIVPYLADGNLEEVRDWTGRVLGSQATTEEIEQKLSILTLHNSEEMAEIASNGEFKRMLTEQAEFMTSVDIIPGVPDFSEGLVTDLVAN